MNDPRYKSGTSLEKSTKEEWRDRLLNELPEVPEAVAEAFDNSLMKLDVWGMRQLVMMIDKLRQQYLDARKEAKQ